MEANGVSPRSGSEVDREIFHAMRGLTDVVLVGAQTVRAEGYGPAQPTCPRWLRDGSRVDRPSATDGSG